MQAFFQTFFQHGSHLYVSEQTLRAALRILHSPTYLILKGTMK
jgi:hypothetical protein